MKGQNNPNPKELHIIVYIFELQWCDAQCSHYLCPSSGYALPGTVCTNRLSLSLMLNIIVFNCGVKSVFVYLYICFTVAAYFSEVCFKHGYSDDNDCVLFSGVCKLRLESEQHAGAGAVGAHAH